MTGLDDEHQKLIIPATISKADAGNQCASEGNNISRSRLSFVTLALMLLLAQVVLNICVTCGLQRLKCNHTVTDKMTVGTNHSASSNLIEKKLKRPNACGKCDMWEHDYIIDLFGTVECKKKCTNESFVFVSSKHHLVEQVAYQWEHGAILPEVLFRISDEKCNYPEAFNVYPAFKVVLRQYACGDQYQQFYDNTLMSSHVFVVPLGYGTDMLKKEKSSIFASSESKRIKQIPRYFSWSFVGNIKSNRPELLEAFESIEPNFQGTASKDEMRDLYGNSTFVLSGRGWVNLGCFRHYEATIMGAIPVVVGKPSEVEATFGYFGERPPWLFAETVNDSVVAVKSLLCDRKEIRRKQLAILEWWQRQLARIEEILSPYMYRSI